ncbi:Uncharacterised protein [Campylobacter hyointestinalis subsp. hyointestinalis]|uniref:Uncharacterized protein n=1 Tax=Campylobacter hyointestinalis subsp. hyointestinalis TaxID=91352 RepID=A0A9W5EUG4_CAMHY|nr:hypothetical protein [Campylobacter hyointestinalis]CUU79380.1 Uncharacterised protein [Campylobacter hyointestinalis subsp. hyointestinalis]
MNFMVNIATYLFIVLFNVFLELLIKLIKFVFMLIFRYVIPSINLLFLAIYTVIVLLLRKLPFYNKLIIARDVILKYGWIMIKDLWLVVSAVAVYCYY